MKCYILILIALIVPIPISTIQKIHRSKRFLLFPYQGTFKTVFSFAIPWKLGPKMEMGVGWNFQFQYPLPYNTTSIEKWPTLSKRRRKRNEHLNDEDTIIGNREIVYEAAEKFLESMNLNGKECLLKTICDYAGSILPDDEDISIEQQMVHMLLTPNNGPEPKLDSDYSDAQKAGEYGIECDSLYQIGCGKWTNLFYMFLELRNGYT